MCIGAYVTIGLMYCLYTSLMYLLGEPNAGFVSVMGIFIHVLALTFSLPMFCLNSG